MNKPLIVAEIRQETKSWLDKHLPEFECEHRACLFFALFTQQKLKSLGIRSLISGGTAAFPRINPSQDDGVCNTHFSYLFEPNCKQTVSRVKSGIFPEMHCWVQLPELGEIVDLTTKYLKKQCKESGGMDWIGDDPPDYIWHKFNKLPLGYLYIPQKEAVEIIKNHLTTIFGG